MEITPTIYYTLQSTIAVMAVYCNKCHKCCRYLDTNIDDNIAFWTKNKREIFCPDCSKDYPKQIYRKVYRQNDIPVDRSSPDFTFSNNSKSDLYTNYQKMYHNDANNKIAFWEYFCTREQEQDELNSGIPKKILCNCRLTYCSDYDAFTLNEFINNSKLQHIGDKRKSFSDMVGKKINLAPGQITILDLNKPKTTIYYTLQSSTAVLAVYCNKCDTCCSFAYANTHDIVAYWTKQKEEIICPDCANDYPNEIYRKVLRQKDIPRDR